MPTMRHGPGRPCRVVGRRRWAALELVTWCDRSVDSPCGEKKCPMPGHLAAVVTEPHGRDGCARRGSGPTEAVAGADARRPSVARRSRQLLHPSTVDTLAARPASPSMVDQAPVALDAQRAAACRPSGSTMFVMAVRVGRTVLPLTDTMTSPALQPGLAAGVCGRPGQCSSDPDLVVVRGTADSRAPPRSGEHEGDEEVHDRAGRGHDDPLVERLLAVGAGLVLRVDLLEVGEPGIFT